MERCKRKGRGEKSRKEKRGRRRKVREAGEEKDKEKGKAEEKRDERKGRLATCPSMGDVEDAEDSLARARGQGHMCPWLQEDGCGTARVPQEPVQVGGLTALDKGQIQSGTRCLHRGGQAQPSGDCREAEGRHPLEQELWPSAVKLTPSPSSEARSSSLPPHRPQYCFVLFCPWMRVAAAVQPRTLSLGTNQGSLVAHDFPSPRGPGAAGAPSWPSRVNSCHSSPFSPCPYVSGALLFISLTTQSQA